MLPGGALFESVSLPPDQKNYYCNIFSDYEEKIDRIDKDAP